MRSVENYPIFLGLAGLIVANQLFLNGATFLKHFEGQFGNLYIVINFTNVQIKKKMPLELYGRLGAVYKLQHSHRGRGG